MPSSPTPPQPSPFDQAAALYHQGRRHQSLDLARQALARHPADADLWNLAGAAADGLGLADEAEAAFRQALAVRPDYAEAHSNLGNLLKEQGRLGEAEAALRRAVELRPQSAAIWNNLGSLLREQGRADAAEAALRRAIELHPPFAAAHYNLAELFVAQRRPAEALAAYRRAAALAPGVPEITAQLLFQSRQACAWGELAAHEARLREQVRAGAATVPPFTFLALPSSAAEQLACARQWGAGKAARTGGAAPSPAPAPRHERIRLGYLSADFHAHATAHLLIEVLEQHDRGTFEVIAYAYGPDDGSDLRARLVRAFDRFVDIRALSHAQAAARIRADQVDILVDLKGYTQDARPAILAYRPAPVQVNWLGYPGTMGTPFMDYLIADAFVAPAEHQSCYSEALVHLPDCYQPNDSRRTTAARTPSRAECGLPEAGFVFCCFNNSYKITPEFFDIWMRLLAQTPGSVLWLLEANPLARANLGREAVARGIDPARLVFAPRAPLPEHLARQRLADLFLDTLPVNAHTTASDALWAGLPVLTCVGATFIGRVAGSLLRTVGLPELITDSPAAYEALALRLTREPALLAALRERLAANRLSTPLFDSERFTRHLEAAYRQMWQHHCAGQAPAAFAVAPTPAPAQQVAELYRQGQLRPALDLAASTLQHRPADAALLHQAATAAYALGAPADAERYWRQAVAARPDFAEAHFSLGVLLKERGQRREAEAALRQAVALNPDHAPAHNHLGVLLHEQARPAEAEAAYRRVLALNPQDANTGNNLGKLLTEQGRAQEAEAVLRQALAASPAHAPAYNNLGILLQGQGRPAQAEAAFRQALALHPTYPQPCNNLGTLLQAEGRLEEAEAAFRQALRLHPQFASAHNNLGTLLQARGRPEEAEAALRQAIALCPRDAGAHYNLGNLLKDRGRLAEALAALRTALAIEPGRPEALNQLLFQSQHACDWRDLAPWTGQLRAAVRAGAGSITPFSVLALPTPPAEQLACARRWAERVAAVDAGAVFSHSPGQPRERIRLGYLSADFCEHATAYLTAELFERHDRGAFEVIAYAYGPDDGGPMRARLRRAFDRFVDIRALSHAQAAARIRADQVDILVDLKGYTQDARPAILAYRPAPVQVNWLGYPGTMGAPFMDYLIADAFVAPFTQQAFYSEALIHLPDCYQPNDSRRAIAAHTPSRAECGLPEAGFVFCCFNNSYKITPEFFAIWMRLLRQTPGSVLWLLATNPLARANLGRAAQARGIDPARLVFAPRAPLPEHLARRPTCSSTPCRSTPTPPPAMPCGPACRCSPVSARLSSAGWPAACCAPSACPG